MYEADTTFNTVTTQFSLSHGGQVIRGNTNGNPTRNYFDGDLETPAGVNMTFLPGTGGKVGIGTATPSSLLDVRSGAVTSGTAGSSAGSVILQGFYGNGA